MLPGRRVAVREQRVGNGPLAAVARIVDDARAGVAEYARDQRRRTARVERQPGAGAEAAHQRAELGPGETDRYGRVTAVGDDQQQRAVGFDAPRPPPESARCALPARD